jgi:hypothetical protein
MRVRRCDLDERGQRSDEPFASPEFYGYGDGVGEYGSDLVVESVGGVAVDGGD